MTKQTLDLLLTRRSVVAGKLGDPGPSQEELTQVLTAAARVPDHKGLAPWRFIVFQGDARAKFGEVLAEAWKMEEQDPSPTRLEAEANRLMRAPVVVAAISSIIDHPAVPKWEQTLSAGAVCQNLVVAATALGFSSQWITEWYSYNESVREALRLNDNERIAGFVYIGTAQEPPKERNRPLLSDIVTEWS